MGATVYGMNRTVYKHLLSTYGRQPMIWFAVCAELIRTIIGRVIVVILLAWMVSSVTVGDFEQAKRLVLIYLIVSLIAIVIGSLGDLAAHYSENLVYGKLQLKYYEKLTHKDMSFYRDNQIGYLTVMLRQYVDSSIILVRILRSDFIRTGISLTIPITILMIYSWQIGVITLILVVFQIIYMLWASTKTKKYRLMAHEIYRKISGEIADDMTNIVAYKSAGREEHAQLRMKKLRVEEMYAFWQRRKTEVFSDAPRGIITAVMASLTFWVVLNTATNTESSVALLVLTFTYMFQIMRNISDLPALINQHDDLVSKLAPTLDTLDSTYEDIKDPIEPISFAPSSASVTIKNLNFRYSEQSKNTHIFKNLNLNIKEGEHIGIVGVSGAGKSTLASLLMRFDEVDSGQILIDGVNIKDVAQSRLRQNIAYVPQEPVLFHRSIKENIAYQNDDAKIESIIAAAKAAHAHDFIVSLPKGYDTVVGERGVKLSGGQKQRVVIARAVLKNAALVLFDEATSALDSESEHIIQLAMPKILGKHTAIIIAHRLSTVAGMDRIIVMHSGKIVEEGTHKELISQGGRYYDLWQKQTRS